MASVLILLEITFAFVAKDIQLINRLVMHEATTAMVKTTLNSPMVMLMASMYAKTLTNMTNQLVCFASVMKMLFVKIKVLDMTVLATLDGMEMNGNVRISKNVLIQF